jgi:uncharacterized protein involved in exopolysaccharide biosynthesis
MKKHKWKILTLFLSTVVTVAVGSLLATPTYHASSRLLVKAGREDVYVPPAGGSPAIVNRSSGQGEKVNAEIAILKSPGLLIKLVDDFGVKNLFDFPGRTLKSRLLRESKRFGVSRVFQFLGRPPEGRLLKENKTGEIPPIETVYESVGNNLEFSALPKSNVIMVTFDWPDPAIAANVVNTLVELYLAQHVKVHTDPQTYSLLKEQAEKWEEKLRKSEKALEAFKRRHSITSLPQQKTILLGKLSEIESEMKGTESEIQETTEMIASLEAQLSSLDQDIQLQETINKDTETLAALKAKLVDFELQGLKEEINHVKKRIAEEEKKAQVFVLGRSPIRQSLETDLLKAGTRLEALKIKGKNKELQTAMYREELKALDGFEKQMNELERQVAIDETNYKLYLTKFEEAKISESMDRQKIANVSVIEPALPPLNPIKPRKKLNVLVGGFLGLLVGIGMAFLTEFINPVFRTREDVDQFLGLPVLVTLPKER